MRQRSAWVIALALSLSACSPQAKLAPSTPSPSAPPPPAASVVPPTPAPPRPTSTPEIVASPQIEVVARGLPGPDDLALAPDGSLWVSDVVAGTISRLLPDGSLQVMARGLQSPEGLAFLPDGGLIIAEQGRNRLVRLDPSQSDVTPWLELPNLTQHPGVDGIAFEPMPPGPALIVPDSPNGQVLRIDLANRGERVLAKGFARPVGAWVAGDGSVWVVDETDPGLVVRIHPDGAREDVARLPTPDDVVVDPSGNVFVTTLTDRAVHWIDPTDRTDRILVSNLGQPQGLTLDASGNLLLADTGLHEILRLIIRASPNGG